MGSSRIDGGRPAAVNPVTLLPLPAAAVNSAFAGGRSLPWARNGLAAAQGQRGGRRYAGIDGGRPAAGQSGNSAQGSISAAVLCPGQGMEWRRSTLLPIPAGQLCPCRRRSILLPRAKNGMAAVNPGNSAALAGRRPFFAQGKEWIGGRPTLILPAAVLYRRSMLPRAKEWIGSSARAAYRRRSLPWAREWARAAG